MRKYTSEEVQEISTNFRDLAKRLLRTDYSQSSSNLIRFISFIDNNELVSEFIKENNVVKYNIEAIIRSRGNWNHFEISAVEKEEISLEYQLLKYSYDKFEGDFTRLYGRLGYIRTRASNNDNLKDFSEHIIAPFVDYICRYLTKYYNQAQKEEKKNSPTANATNTITAHNSTVLLGSQVGGDISNVVFISNEELQQAIERIDQVELSLHEIVIENQEDFIELINEIKEDLRNQRRPKKSLLTALKTLATGTVSLTPLITEIIKMLYSS